MEAPQLWHPLPGDCCLVLVGTVDLSFTGAVQLWVGGWGVEGDAVGDPAFAAISSCYFHHWFCFHIFVLLLLILSCQII